MNYILASISFYVWGNKCLNYQHTAKIISYFLVLKWLIEIIILAVNLEAHKQKGAIVMQC